MLSTLRNWLFWEAPVVASEATPWAPLGGGRCCRLWGVSCQLPQGWLHPRAATSEEEEEGQSPEISLHPPLCGQVRWALLEAYIAVWLLCPTVLSPFPSQTSLITPLAPQTPSKCELPENSTVTLCLVHSNRADDFCASSLFFIVLGVQW